MNEQNKLPLLLMIASNLLLLVFLLFWLQSVYFNEEIDLQKETNFMFVNDIRQIEDAFFYALFPSLESDSLDVSLIDKMKKIQIQKEDEAVPQILIHGLEANKFPTILKDSSMQVVIRSHVNEANDKEVDGAISMWISLNDEERVDSSIMTNIHQDKSQTLALIKDHFSTSINEAELSINYTIVEVASDSLKEKKGVVSSHYFDTYSNINYVLEIDHYQTLLLKRMWPQIVFSIFLFSCISLAFYVVYQSLEKQKRLTLLKNDLISNITHELKTPITTVGVAIEALRNFDITKNPKQTKEYLDISQNELKRLSILVDKVLKMSMFDKQSPVLNMEWINLKDLTKEVLNTMKLQFEKDDAQVQFTYAGENFNTKGDRIHLTSVLYNLIDNALKYSLKKPVIDIVLISSNESLQLKITDKGMGISTEYKDRVFDKFFRIPNGNEHNIKGYGLGLSYVAEVIKTHKGNIDLRSSEGEGSCFTIKFPVHEKG